MKTTQRTNSSDSRIGGVRGSEEQQRIRDSYFLWLCSFVERRATADKRHCLAILFERGFYGRIPNDENRAEDGLHLRNRFYEETGQDVELSLRRAPCSMLEMLIALSCHIDYFIIGESPAKWFWEMIDNLGLHIFAETDPLARSLRHENDIIIQTFLEREYRPNGKGGLFPLKKAYEDQRGTEIWYQMQEYLQERFSED